MCILAWTRHGACAVLKVNDGLGYMDEKKSPWTCFWETSASKVCATCLSFMRHRRLHLSNLQMQQA